MMFHPELTKFTVKFETPEVFSTPEMRLALKAEPSLKIKGANSRGSRRLKTDRGSDQFPNKGEINQTAAYPSRRGR